MFNTNLVKINLFKNNEETSQELTYSPKNNSYLGRHVHWLKEERQGYRKFAVKALILFESTVLVVSILGLYVLKKAVEESARLDQIREFERTIQSTGKLPPSEDETINTSSPNRHFDEYYDYAIENEIVWYRPRNSKNKWESFYHEKLSANSADKVIFVFQKIKGSPNLDIPSEKKINQTTQSTINSDDEKDEYFERTLNEADVISEESEESEDDDYNNRYFDAFKSKEEWSSYIQEQENKQRKSFLSLQDPASNPLFTSKIWLKSLADQDDIYHHFTNPLFNFLANIFSSSEDEASKLSTSWRDELKKLGSLWKSSGSEEQNVDEYDERQVNQEALYKYCYTIHQNIEKLMGLDINASYFIQKISQIEIPETLDIDFEKLAKEGEVVLKAYKTNPEHVNFSEFFRNNDVIKKWPIEFQIGLTAIVYNIIICINHPEKISLLADQLNRESLGAHPLNPQEGDSEKIKLIKSSLKTICDLGLKIVEYSISDNFFTNGLYYATIIAIKAAIKSFQTIYNLQPLPPESEFYCQEAQIEFVKTPKRIKFYQTSIEFFTDLTFTLIKKALDQEIRPYLKIAFHSITLSVLTENYFNFKGSQEEKSARKLELQKGLIVFILSTLKILKNEVFSKIDKNHQKLLSGISEMQNVKLPNVDEWKLLPWLQEVLKPWRSPR